MQRHPGVTSHKDLPVSSAFTVSSDGDLQVSKASKAEIHNRNFENNFSKDFAVFHRVYLRDNAQSSVIAERKQRETDKKVRSHVRLVSEENRLRFVAVMVGCLITLAAITVLLWMRLASRDQGENRRTPVHHVIQVSSMGYIFLFTMSVTAIIPEAYGLMLTEGKGPTASGWLIGSPWAFCAFSSLCMRPLVANDCWSQSRNRLIVVCSYVLMASSVLVFAMAANHADVLGNRRFFLLVTSRITMGLADGPNLILTVMTWKITPRTEMVRYEISRVCCKCAGIGMGPILSSLVALVSGAEGAAARSAHSSYIIAVCWIIFGVATWQAIPLDLTQHIKMKEAEDIKSSTDEHGAQDAASTLAIESLPEQVRKKVWCSVVMYGTERTFVVSGLEAGTALVLETEFRWDTKYIGLAIGLTFLGGLPLAIVANAIQRPSSFMSAKLMCVAAALSVVSSICLFPSIGQYLSTLSGSNAVGPLLLADSIIFTGGYLANGVMDAYAVRSSMPGTIFSIENLKLIDSVIQNSLARFIAPPIARWCLESHGRTYYASGQLIISVLGCISCFSVAHLLLRNSASGNGTDDSNSREDSPRSLLNTEGSTSGARKAREVSRPGWRSPKVDERTISAS